MSDWNFLINIPYGMDVYIDATLWLIFSVVFHYFELEAGQFFTALDRMLNYFL